MKKEAQRTSETCEDHTVSSLRQEPNHLGPKLLHLTRGLYPLSCPGCQIAYLIMPCKLLHGGTR